MAFTLTEHGNELLDCGTFYISYRKRFGELNQVLGSLAQLLGGDEDLTKELPETALVTEDEAHRFRILIGDYRKDYSALAEQGVDACIAFFNSQREEHGGAWSTSEEDRATKELA
jgi:hypothetical protein